MLKQKKILQKLLFGLFFLITIPFSLNSQESASDTEDTSDNQTSPKLGLGMEFGNLNVGSVNYFTMRLQPDLAIGKFGVGLDVNFEFDAQGNFRTTEYSTWQAVLSKIVYVRYGVKGEPVFAKLGGISDFTLGNGTIVNNYNNRLNYPSVKKIGLEFDLDFKISGFIMSLKD